MAEVPAGVPEIELVQVDLPGVGEGGVADVMAQGDGLDQIQVQAQHPTDHPGDAGNQLHMKAAAGYVVIPDKGENLRLVAVSVIIRAVHDLVGIMDKGRTPDSGVVRRGHRSAKDIAVVKTEFGIGPGLLLTLDALGQHGGQGFVVGHGLTSVQNWFDLREVILYTKIPRNAMQRRRVWTSFWW